MDNSTRDAAARPQLARVDPARARQPLAGIVAIPAWLVTHPDVDGTSFRVYCYLVARYNRTSRVAFPSAKTVGDGLDISVRSVRRAIKVLVGLGLIGRRERYAQNGRQTSNGYVPLFSAWDDLAPGQDDHRHSRPPDVLGGDVEKVVIGDTSVTGEGVTSDRGEGVTPVTPLQPIGSIGGTNKTPPNPPAESGGASTPAGLPQEFHKNSTPGALSVRQSSIWPPAAPVLSAPRRLTRKDRELLDRLDAQARGHRCGRCDQTITERDLVTVTQWGSIAPNVFITEETVITNEPNEPSEAAVPFTEGTGLSIGVLYEHLRSTVPAAFEPRGDDRERSWRYWLAHVGTMLRWEPGAGGAATLWVEESAGVYGLTPPVWGAIIYAAGLGGRVAVSAIIHPEHRTHRGWVHQYCPNAQREATT